MGAGLRGPFETLAEDQEDDSGSRLQRLCRDPSENEIRVQSNTTREKCYGEDPTKAVVCDLTASRESELTVSLRRPVARTVRVRLADLVDDNVVTFTGGFTTESFIIERLVGPSEYSAAVRWEDRRDPGDGPDWYYVRVTQHNGHAAWSSPVWVG